MTLTSPRRRRSLVASGVAPAVPSVCLDPLPVQGGSSRPPACCGGDQQLFFAQHSACQPNVRTRDLQTVCELANKTEQRVSGDAIGNCKRERIIVDEVGSLKAKTGACRSYVPTPLHRMSRCRACPTSHQLLNEDGDVSFAVALAL